MTSPITYVKQTRDELKQVTWPTRETVTRLTLVVLLISVVVGLYIGILDLVLTELTKLVIK